MLDAVELHHRFAYHPPATSEVATDHENVREACWRVANYLNELVPDGREKATMMTKLEEAMFWANAAIARNHPPSLVPPQGELPDFPPSSAQAQAEWGAQFT